MKIKTNKKKKKKYESKLNGILRTLQGIEKKHVKWQWNHENDIEKDRNMVVNPKMENETCNTNKWIGLKIINETYERLKTHKNDESRWKPHKMNIKTIKKQEIQAKWA